MSCLNGLDVDLSGDIKREAQSTLQCIAVGAAQGEREKRKHDRPGFFLQILSAGWGISRGKRSNLRKPAEHGKVTKTPRNESSSPVESFYKGRKLSNMCTKVNSILSPSERSLRIPCPSSRMNNNNAYAFCGDAKRRKANSRVRERESLCARFLREIKLSLRERD